VSARFCSAAIRTDVARELRDRFPSAQLIAEGEELGQLVARSWTSSKRPRSGSI
jgi:hypothetical protein